MLKLPSGLLISNRPTPGTKDKIIYLTKNNASICDTDRALHISINLLVRLLKYSCRGG
ncbi:IS1-like element transposase [Providencia manganoxydans]